MRIVMELSVVCHSLVFNVKKNDAEFFAKTTDDYGRLVGLLAVKAAFAPVQKVSGNIERRSWKIARVSWNIVSDDSIRAASIREEKARALRPTAVCAIASADLRNVAYRWTRHV